MSFKKPFRAEPVKLSPHWQAKEDAAGRKNKLKRLGAVILIALVTFLAGMAVTNLKNLIAKLPVYYRNCDSARAAGATPIHRGEPGYRAGLDADRDGIACEPYFDF